MKNGSIVIQRTLGILFVVALLVSVVPMATSAEPLPQGPITYYVRYGDTLFSIAQRFGTTVQAIMQANGLTTDYIYSGQLLMIPTNPLPPLPTLTPFPTPSNFDCTYIVQYRDTVFSISYRYGVPYYVLMQANYMYTSYLRVGQTLRVPCLTPAPTPFPVHVIQPGQNLFRVAIQYNTSIYAIALTNGIPNPHWVYAGQLLVIPYPGSKIWPNVPTVTSAFAAGPTNTPGPTATPTVTATTGPLPTPTATTGIPTAFFVMSNMQFVPPSLTVPKGTTVQWNNVDGVNHTVTSGTPGAPTNVFRSGTLAPNATFRFTFSEVGTFPFFSELDANMTGTITVQ